MTIAIQVALKTYLRLCLTALMLYPVLLWAQSQPLTARLDRTQMVLGETVTLRIERQGSAGGLRPDLSVLEGQFEVLNSNTQTQVNISNGQQQAITQLQLVLEPKQAGELTIPPIPVGDQYTPALSLSVQPEPEITDSDVAPPDFVLEMQAEPSTPYVQAQFTVVVRLLYATQINDAALSEPEPSGVIIEKLGEDTQYTAQRAGRRYNVVERRYAMFAQRSGRLEIAPVQLSGRVGGSARSSFFNSSAGRRITRRSNALEIDVLPVPAAYTGAEWLPASALQLRESGIDQTFEYRVGEPLTRTIELSALGLADVMLPDIAAPAPDGTRVYADKPVGNSGVQGKQIIGQRTVKQAIVPTTAGTLQLPAIQLDWWDTTSNRQRQASIPASTIEILPALDNGSSSAQGSLPLPAPAAVSEAVSNGPIEPGLWPYMSFGFAGLWLLTLLAWWRARHAQRGVPELRTAAAEQQALTIRAARQACREACQDNAPTAAAAALTAWAGAAWDDVGIKHLGQVINALEQTQWRQALLELERACYRRQQADWDGTALQALLARGLPARQRKHDPVKADDSLLPELYPPLH